MRWNNSRPPVAEDDGWVKDGERLLLWTPLQYRRDIRMGTRAVIAASLKHAVRPEVDYRKVFRYSGARWRDIYTGTSGG